jgi:hypothetical protein
MPTIININRNGSSVTYETVSVMTADLVVWKNNDTQDAHWPSLLPNPLGPSPSPNSSAVALVNPGGTPPTDPPNLAFQLVYNDYEPNYKTVKGIINVFNPFQSAATSLPAQKVNTPIAAPIAVTQGGMSPYSITGELYQVTVQNAIVSQGSGPGPGLTLQEADKIDPAKKNVGVVLTGTPAMTGTYTFTFNATDGMGLNVQQNQFTMVVS